MKSLPHPVKSSWLVPCVFSPHFNRQLFALRCLSVLHYILNWPSSHKRVFPCQFQKINSFFSCESISSKRENSANQYALVMNRIHEWSMWLNSACWLEDRTFYLPELSKEQLNFVANSRKVLKAWPEFRCIIARRGEKWRWPSEHLHSDEVEWVWNCSLAHF